MSLGGRTFRAFRPSSFSPPEELQEEVDLNRQAKIHLYLKRAEEGLPLFEADQQLGTKRRYIVA